VNALASWRRLNLWPRLVVTVTLGFLLLFGVFSLLAFAWTRAIASATPSVGYVSISGRS